MSKQHKLTMVDSLKPGQMQRFVVDAQPVLLANVDGKFFAIEDMCSHEDAALTHGALKGNCVECPLHGSRFDLETGLPKEEPATEPVKTYLLEIKENTVYITLDPSD